MSSKKANTEDLGLSLTGSQFGTPLSSSRSRPNSAKLSNRSATTPKGRPKASNGALSGRSDLSSARTTGRQCKPRTPTANPKSAKDDFLALFESNTQPKATKRKPQGKGAVKPAWATPLDSARSSSTLVADQATTQASSSRFSHSVFLPNSARSTSTIDTVDDCANLQPKASKHTVSAAETLLEFGQRMCEDDLSASLNSRSSHHGGNEFSVDTQQDAQKATKLNSIANNMTSQAFSPGAKTPLMSMENSYQNIKHKTVNQTSQKGRNVKAEDFVKVCNMAATKIQRWYMRHCVRRRSGEAAIKRLLQDKREEKEAEKKRDRKEDQNKEEERKRVREEKARQARQNAIQELQRKREEKRSLAQKTAEEEVRFLQANGKVSKTPARVGKKRIPKLKPPVAQNNGDSGSDTASSRHSSLSPADPCSTQPKEIVSSASPEQLPDLSQAASSKVTMDDLMNTLHKLEEDAKFPTARNEKENKKPFGWLDDLEPSDRSSSKGSERNRLSAEKLHKLQDSEKTDNVSKSGLLSDAKLQSIMHYLNDVESAERLSEIDQELIRANDQLERPALLVPSTDELQELEQATIAASEITQQMLTQKMELEDKKRTANMLQKALSQQRELTVRHARETEREMKKRLDVQKEEYEETIKRHLGFIDQLIDDKKSLSEKCEQVVKELKVVSKKYEDRIKSIQDNHEVETRKLKDVQAAAEKLRREKWMDEKTKKIKEMTVKGLEPEIQRLIAKHKAELKKMNSIHEAELLASDERAGQRYIKMTEELRDQLAHEKEAACARERDLARQTYEKQMQQEEEAYQQQRRRLYTEVQEEKDRQAQQASRQRAELDRLQRQLEDAHSNSSTALKMEYEKARQEQEKRHHSEMRLLKEQLAAEKMAWEENHLKMQDAWAASKERELRENVRKERDHEIEMVIERLEADNQNSREECQRVADNRIKRIRDKYEAEVEELERSERQTMERYNQTKAALAEYEGENERLKVTMKQKDREVMEVKRLLDKLNEERDRVSDVIRQEFADRLVTTDEENKRVKNAMSELKARHRIEVERAKEEVEEVKKAKEVEMEEVHKRVKQAILKKEDVVTQLKNQYQAAVKRADHLEGLLEQQRKQLLGKK